MGRGSGGTERLSHCEEARLSGLSGFCDLLSCMMSA